MAYFWGAMYLFTINTIFIGLAAFVVLKVLRFPMLKYANSKKRKRIAQLASLVAIVVMIPAIWTFINVLTETKYQRDYKNFMKNEVKSNDDLWLQRDTLDMQEKQIKLFFNGSISKEMMTSLNNDLKDYENIQNFKLVINSNDTRSADLIMTMYDKATIDLEQKDILIGGLQSKMDSLERTISRLKSSQANPAYFKDVAKDAKIKFSNLESFGYATMLETKDFNKLDTITLAKVKWNNRLKDSLLIKTETDLKAWLTDRLKAKNVVIKRD